MWPSLRSGDRACLAGDVRAVEKNDVVVIRLGHELVVHRVIKILSSDRIQTRGDNCASDDPPVSVGAVLGRVEQVERGAQRMSTAQWDFGPCAPARWYLRLRRAYARREGRVA